MKNFAKVNTKNPEFLQDLTIKKLAKLQWSTIFEFEKKRNMKTRMSLTLS